MSLIGNPRKGFNVSSFNQQKRDRSARFTVGAAEATYVRKVEDGQYEYGFVRRFVNFRKNPDIYTVVGIETSVSKAEAARSSLQEITAAEMSKP